MNIKKFRSVSLIISSVVLATALAGCQPAPIGGAGTFSSPTADTTQTTPQEEASITISNFKFDPATVTVRPGATISVTNKDAVGHSLTSDDGSSFDTGIIAQDATGQFTAPTTAGTYTYHCTPHPNMKATLIVE